VFTWDEFLPHGIALNVWARGQTILMRFRGRWIMNVHASQHVSFEGRESIEAWLLAARGAVTHTTRFFDLPQLPELADLNLVIALGGPMSVNDEAELPCLKEE
jgi:hypothetical protein